MKHLLEERPDVSAALRRLSMLAPLDEGAHAALRTALSQTTTMSARRDIVGEAQAMRGPLLVVQGWAARVRQLHDGRRQLLSFLLPGDFIGLCDQPEPLATFTVSALTEVRLCPAPARSAGLEQVYAVSRALEEVYLLEQITRLGRLSALERIYSLLLEFNERLALGGLAAGGGFAMPLTQELLADALGLTSSTSTACCRRRAGLATWNGRAGASRSATRRRWRDGSAGCSHA